MKYTNMVNLNQDVLRSLGFAKVAADLAQMLDNKIFVVNLKEIERFYIETAIWDRKWIFDRLCHVFARCGLTVPELERELFDFYLPQDNKIKEEDAEMVTLIENQIRPQLKTDNSQEVEIIEGALAVLKIFPGCGGEYSITIEHLITLINDNIIRMGGRPFRPDYANKNFSFPGRLFKPSPLPLRVLIVDDSSADIIRTSGSFIGWENITLDLLQHKDADNKNPKPEKDVARRIIERGPDIVLMDQGLSMSFSGSDVIREFKNLEGGLPLFIANTGGDPHELNKLGAMGNCDKGKDMEIVKRIVAEANMIKYRKNNPEPMCGRY